MSTKTTRDNDHDDHHDCVRWAAQWSQHYRNTERYIPPNVVTTTTTRTSLSSSWLSLFLKRYLSTHGLLVTMCASLNSWQACVLPTPMTHWSASWINAYFLSSNDNNNNSSSSSSRSDPQSLLFPTTSQVGMILDPKKVHIRCLYPTDGNTQFRSAQGCGPVEGGGVGAGKVGGGMGRTMQRPFPSLPSSSLLSSTMRDLILQHKNLNFGVDTPWTDFDCQDFFPMVGGVAGRDQLSLLWHWANQQNTTTANTTTPTTTTTSSSSSAANPSTDHHHHPIVQGAYEYVQEQYAHIMGHDVCNATVRGRQTHGIYYVYTDQDSWNVPALDWQTVMDYQWQIIQNNDSSRSSQPQSLSSSSSSMSTMSSPYSVKAHFNEIVMDLPLPQLQNVVLAVFYIVDDNNDSQEQRETRRKLAHAQARILGNKIVLQMSTTGSTTTTNNNNNLPDLLTCDDDDDYDDNHNNHKDRPSEGGSQVSSTV